MNPAQLPGYQFMSNNYHAYVQQHCALPADSQVAQAALLQGGIVWWLTMATLSFDNVLYGPLLQHASNSLLSWCYLQDWRQLCIDGLTQLE